MSGFSSGFDSGFGETIKNFIIPDSQFEIPELFIPGQKPVGEIQLNLLNEFGRHVTTGICQAKNITHDINQDDPLGTGGFELYSGATIRRDDVFCGADNSCVISRNTIYVDRYDVYSILFRGIFNGSYNAYNYLVHAQSYKDFSFYFDPDSYWYVNSKKTIGQVALPLNTPYSVCMTTNGRATPFNIYFSFNSSILTGDTANIDDVQDFLDIGGRDGSADRYSNHEIGIAALLDKALSEEEAHRWMADPYQIFEPA